MDGWDRGTSLSHFGRTTFKVVSLLVVGAVLAVGALKLAHKVHWSTPATSVASASAGYGLDAPTGAAVAGGDLFVTNQLGNSVTEVDASTGAHMTTIQGSTFGFNQPTAILTVGPDLFVANGGGDSVTEVDAADRTMVRMISGTQYQLSDPMALASDDGRLYILSAGGSVTAVSADTGALVGVASGPQFHFATPLGIAATGSHVYVTNSTADTVTVIDAPGMTFDSLLQGASFKFSQPTGAVIFGNDLWVANYKGDSVTEVATATGTVVRVIVDHTNLPTPGPITSGDGYVFTVSPPGTSPMVSQIEPGQGTVPWMICNTNGPYLFSNPQAAAVSGQNLWVVSKDSSSLTEMNTDSGALIRTIS
jgi:outer membrane protein assembly factor BamB